MPAEKRFELSRLEPKRRAAFSVLEEEESGEPSLRQEQLERPPHVVRPQRSRERAQEGALVYQIEGRAEIEFEEVREVYSLRRRSEDLLRTLHRRRCEIYGEHVEYALVLAAFDAPRLLREVGAREAALRFAPAHAAPGPVGAGAERLGVAFAAHDIGARAHAPRDDAELAFARADRTLTRYVNPFAEMLLLLHVIVMAVDRLIGDLERRKVAMQCLEDQFQHLGPVRERVVLRPADRLDVVVESLRAFGQPGEVAIGEVHVRLQHRLARLSDEILADAVAG